MALLLGVLGDGLLRALPWGINLPLWIGAIVATILALLRWRAVTWTGTRRWLLVPAVFFAGAVAWRDSEVLTFLNILAILTALGLAAFRVRDGAVHLAGVAEYVLGLIDAGLHAIGGGLFLLLQDIRWAEIPRHDSAGRILAVARGLAIAVPLTLLFGALFAAADAAFEGIVGRLFGWSLRELIGHLFLAGFLAWIVGGYLRQELLGASVANPFSRPSGMRLGIVELGIVLGMLDLLFLAFVLVQFRYLFGGADLVEASSTLTYSEYARRGFFELVWVSTLALPLLLGLEWLLRAERPAQLRAFRVLAAAMIAMLFVIMISAVRRMLLYVDEFGLTELRVYPTAFMGWLALVFIWYLATVLRGRRERFAFGALHAGFATLAALNAINPDDLIVRTNANRPDSPRPFDARYARSLSEDAIPALGEALLTMPEPERRRTATNLLNRWDVLEQADWRTWNWGREQARRSIAANERQLREIERAGG